VSSEGNAVKEKVPKWVNFLETKLDDVNERKNIFASKEIVSTYRNHFDSMKKAGANLVIFSKESEIKVIQPVLKLLTDKKFEIFDLAAKVLQAEVPLTEMLLDLIQTHTLEWSQVLFISQSGIKHFESKAKHVDLKEIKIMNQLKTQVEIQNMLGKIEATSPFIT